MNVRKWAYNIGGLLIAVTCFCFALLKINQQITWSWFWVLSPIWISLALIILILILFQLSMMYIDSLPEDDNKGQKKIRDKILKIFMWLGMEAVLIFLYNTYAWLFRVKRI